jgi:hypothetical protein
MVAFDNDGAHSRFFRLARGFHRIDAPWEQRR